ncbi:cytidine deaminase [Sphingopyxis bauzanensis]|uniref:Cytidine deaminase n=1 Tax=Sphingopyxis bauzanensis TaxID=651663 RepID=A0A246JSP6_9SPHN|nr:cytidine deaminase [Sphingopyxis bauzanensis]MDP3781403.1 cytidine deaminase [Sphingopyxis sp.]OWQ96030.1 cytidine deaminase [Sphingopyxis bauzanensis]GGJ52459.1 cytidine deaminase [Sphingopyxis bauzanensis]
MTEPRDELIAAARDAASRAYAPYSGFQVGAALLLKNGDVVTGANVENASYGLTLCAETVAVAKIVNEGWIGELAEVAIIGGRPDGDALIGTDPVNPCGRCRQILNEAAERSKTDILVHCASGDGTAVKTYKLSELLPAAFGPKDLGLV